MNNSSILDLVFIGLSITSSWGNGHASTYRGLLAALAARGHRISFLERDVPWYAANRDLPSADYCRVELYSSPADLKERFGKAVRAADAVIIGSYVPDGIEVARWATAAAGGLVAFYDIDTPVTVAAIEKNACGYLTADLMARFDLYLSFSGGPFLDSLQEKYRLPATLALYCSADPAQYYPLDAPERFDLGYMGTFSADRQGALENLLIEPARQWANGRFVVAGPQYPPDLRWPANIERCDHIAPEAHRDFYGSQRFTLNLTRADMIRAGFSPSVRLFEAAACATVIISDDWQGLDSFFVPGEEILISRNSEETLHWLRHLDDARRLEMGLNAYRRFLSAHTPDHRAAELEKKLHSLLKRPIGCRFDASSRDADDTRHAAKIN